MKEMKALKELSALAIFLIVFSSCSTVPLTGRRQLNLVSDQEILSLSNQSYNDYLKTAKLSTNTANTAMVVRVGRNIANAVESYLKQNGRSADIKQFSWEFHLVQDATPNAFCMPGGKIVVNEGILPYTKDESGLAVVLGHEVAHAVAKHSSERMSQQLLLNYGGAALGILLENKSELAQSVAQQVYGVGSQVGVMLPYSRLNENEADEMGLIFTAMAGYDPRVAIQFWERMQAASANVPEFLSTHPSDATRIKRLQGLMPEALKYYKAK